MFQPLTGHRRLRAAIAVVVGASVLALVSASAASLGGVTLDQLGATSQRSRRATPTA